ncbi:Golgi-associated plant pathogenesis-related protein 1-like [Mercenaria mercenaria]|uniref:Golgi-associated plant pathogenesis-related protein 1-like n=1 Tax=Mercenaria mercenaria TaxID=6596 RepID=UPI00234EEBF4|nr:Golgi-associated plant pathogenesis-related protein 1-like [Mercenaria mercenaria]
MALRHLIFLCLLTTVLCAKVKLDKKFIKQVVKEHNKIRAEHGVDPVKKNTKMSKYAQKWANYLYENGKFEHRSDSKYGENLSYMSGSAKGKDHVQNLYLQEEQHYRDNGYYGTEPPMGDFANFGHFTQIVWKGSTKIGVGIAGGIVVVNYDPPGNMIGDFIENVSDKS